MGMANNAPELGRALSVKEYRKIHDEIMEFHRFGVSGRMIKYILPTFDTRTTEIFHVQFQGMFEPVAEGKEFDYRDNDRAMFDNIMEWLNEAKKVNV